MPWTQGQSGNPKGRVRGSGKLDKLRAELAKELPEVLEALVAQARAGDTSAIKLILECTLPALRPVDAAAPLNLPVDGGLAEQGRAVLAALEREIATLRGQLADIAADRDRWRLLAQAKPKRARTVKPKIPADQWRRLMQLAHPDRHGGSEAAHKATQWLLEVRPS